MSRKLLLLTTLLACGAAALGLGLRALAQSAPPVPAPVQAGSAAPAGTASTAAPAAPSAAPVAATGSDDDAELKQSADNNLSFPVDI